MGCLQRHSRYFFFNDTATTEIYTLSYTTLFRSWDANPQAYNAFKAGIRRLQKEWTVIVAGGRETDKELERLFGEYVRTALVKRAQRLQEARKEIGRAHV